jgi:hypothetical protein
MFISDQYHHALDAILSSLLSPSLLLFSPSLGIRARVPLLEGRGQFCISRCRRRSAAHGTIGFYVCEVGHGIEIRAEVSEIEVEQGGHDVGQGGRVGPLHQTRSTEDMVAASFNRVVKEEVTYRAVVIVRNLFDRRRGGSHVT